jgi:hypothetical protein
VPCATDGVDSRRGEASGAALEAPLKRPRRFNLRSTGSFVIDVSSDIHLAPLFRICSLTPSTSGVAARSGKLKTDRNKKPDKSAKRLRPQLILVLYIMIFLLISISDCVLFPVDLVF